MDNKRGIKRKWQGGKEENFNLLSKISKVETQKPLFEIDFHLQRSLPRLDIKQLEELEEKKTCKDQRKTSAPMSLELELNLPSNWITTDKPESRLSLNLSPSPNKSESLARCTSWIAFEEDHKEMVTTCWSCCVSLHLHDLIAKFVHPPEKNPIGLFKPRVGLLPCKE